MLIIEDIYIYIYIYIKLHILFDTKIENQQGRMVPHILLPHSEIWNRNVNIDEETQK